eukprot:EST45758.1 Hypothetical protein SS50377_14329 [Spironucleus salmonicida]
MGVCYSYPTGETIQVAFDQNDYFKFLVGSDEDQNSNISYIEHIESSTQEEISDQSELFDMLTHQIKH